MPEITGFGRVSLWLLTKVYSIDLVDEIMRTTVFDAALSNNAESDRLRVEVSFYIGRLRRNRRSPLDIARTTIRDLFAHFGHTVIFGRCGNCVLNPILCRHLTSGDERGSEASQCFL
ncbi:MAG: hypothetical protein WBV25_03045 [Methylocella sp.]